MNRIARTLVMIATLVATLSSLHTGRAAETRYVTASAQCTGGTSSIPNVSVTIANHSGLTLYIAYNGSFSGQQAIGEDGLVGLNLVAPGTIKTSVITNDTSATLDSPWVGRTPKAGESFSALVVTNAGILLPTCDENPVKLTYDGSQPTLAGEEGMESATIMAKTLGELESFHAYPALYALLAQDVRDQVSYGTVACWYAAQYGPSADGKSQTIYSTDVANVKWVNWSWPVTGTKYGSVAEVTYTQSVGIFPKQETTASQTEHLYRGDDHVWRWFFGTDANDLAKLPTSCGLPASV